MVLPAEDGGDAAAADGSADQRSTGQGAGGSSLQAEMDGMVHKQQHAAGVRAKRKRSQERKCGRGRKHDCDEVAAAAAAAATAEEVAAAGAATLGAAAAAAAAATSHFLNTLEYRIETIPAAAKSTGRSLSLYLAKFEGYSAAYSMWLQHEATGLKDSQIRALCTLSLPGGDRRPRMSESEWQRRNEAVLALQRLVLQNRMLAALRALQPEQ
ncbi:hypothetical protein ABPG75_004273 [Micractinium tetrahymenae]